MCGVCLENLPTQKHITICNAAIALRRLAIIERNRKQLRFGTFAHQKKGVRGDGRIHRSRTSKRNNAKAQMFRLHERKIFGLFIVSTSQTFC